MVLLFCLNLGQMKWNIDLFCFVFLAGGAFILILPEKYLYISMKLKLSSNSII